MKIRVGSNQWRSGGQLLDVKRQLRHTNYSFKGVSLNDIGIITIQGVIQFNERVQPVKYDSVEPSAGTKLLATGIHIIRSISHIFFTELFEKN